MKKKNKKLRKILGYIKDVPNIIPMFFIQITIDVSPKSRAYMKEKGLNNNLQK